MISYYWQKIKDNGQLTDVLDLVRGQKRQKAFDYTFSTVKGTFFKGDKILYQCSKTSIHTFVCVAINLFQELFLQTITNRSFTMSLTAL